MQNIFLSIGIEYKDSEELSRLRGAIPSAIALKEWAHSHGYSTDCITDHENPVTVERVKRALENLIGGGGQHRVIICFAGHGLIRDGAEELWLMNDWQAEIGAINHAKLRERLKGYGIKQIAIVNDACRNLVSDTFRDIVGSPVIRMADYEHDYVETTVINGTKAGRSSYSTPILHSQQYCFLTRALYETLTNLNETWDEKEKLTHSDLFRILLKKVPEIARKFNVTQLPEPTGIFLEPEVWSAKPNLTSSLQALEPIIRKQETRSAITEGSVLQQNSELMALNMGTPQPSATVRSITSRLSDERDNQHQFISRNIFLSGIRGTKVFSNRSSSYPRGGMETAETSLIGLANSEWCGAATYQYLSTNFIYSNEGIVSLSMGDRSSWDEQPLMEEIFSALSGYGFSEAVERAAEIRQDKHYNPVLGVIAAYTYYRLGAIDDIRRTAYFYGKHRQALPFDIALLANIPCSFNSDGIVARIPAVRERLPTNEAEARREYTYKATSEIEVHVAGSFPWMRQGWNLCEDNRNCTIRELARFQHGVKRSLFSTFDSETGQELVRYLGLNKEELANE